MNKGFLVLALGTVAGASQAAFFVAGAFNGWNPGDPGFQMTWDGSKYTKLVTGLTPGADYEFKVTIGDWSTSWAGSNVKATASASGDLLVTFHDLTGPSWGDGWLPDTVSRVGYDNGNAHSWEVMGSFNGWSSPIVTLNHVGGGVYEGTTFVAAGMYDYKIRKSSTWDISVGDDFGNSAANVSLNVGASSLYTFKIDTVGGRIQAAAVPEPATLAVLGLGGAALLRRRRR